MKKLILTVFGGNSKNGEDNSNVPSEEYYGGLLNQGAYGK